MKCIYSVHAFRAVTRHFFSRIVQSVHSWTYNKLQEKCFWQPTWQFWDSGGVKLESLCKSSIVGCQWTVNYLLGMHFLLVSFHMIFCMSLGKELHWTHFSCNLIKVGPLWGPGRLDKDGYTDKVLSMQDLSKKSGGHLEVWVACFYYVCFYFCKSLSVFLIPT